MSIIYEALKKAQRRLKITPIKTEEEKRWPWFYLGFIVASLLGCVFVLVLIFYTPKIKTLATSNLDQKQKSIDEKRVAPTKVEYKPSRAIEYESDPSKFPKNTLKLDGIIYMNDDYIALINNRILKKGDFIEGAQIIGISDNSVDLKFGDSNFNLRLK